MKKIFFKLSAGNTTNSNIEYFENKGQWDNKVLFKADIFGGWAFLEKNTITYMFMETDKILHRHNHNSQSRQDGNEDLDVHADENAPSIIKGHVYKVNYLNANETATCNGENKLVKMSKNHSAQKKPTNIYLADNKRVLLCLKNSFITITISKEKIKRNGRRM